MKKLNYDIAWTAIKILLNATRHRAMFNEYDQTEKKHKLNLKYMYVFPIDNDKDDRSDYHISTKSLYEYFNKKDYEFTVCNFNSPPDETYSYNSNSIILVLPEYINFSSKNIRAKMKLSSDISYLDVYYYDDNIKNIVLNCVSSFTEQQKNQFKKSQIMKALLNEYEH